MVAPLVALGPIVTAVGRFAVPYLAKELGKIGTNKFIQTYGNEAFTSLNETLTKNTTMVNPEAMPMVNPNFMSKKDDEETSSLPSIENKQDIPQQEPPEDKEPGLGTEVAAEAALQISKNLSKQEDIKSQTENLIRGIGDNNPPSAIEEQTKELLGENLTVDTVLDKNLLDELLVVRGGIEGFKEKMAGGFAPLPGATKSKMTIELQEKLFNKYNIDKFPEGKTPENTTKEEQESIRKKFNTQLEGIEYIVSAAYDAIPGTKVDEKNIDNGYSVFTLDNEGLPIAGAKIKKFIKVDGNDKTEDGSLNKVPAIYITEMGSINTNATSKLLNKIKEIAKENNINYVVAEDLTSKEALEAFKKRGFKPTLSKEYQKFKGRKIQRPYSNRLILQKNLVLNIK